MKIPMAVFDSGHQLKLVGAVQEMLLNLEESHMNGKK